MSATFRALALGIALVPATVASAQAQRADRPPASAPARTLTGFGTLPRDNGGRADRGGGGRRMDGASSFGTLGPAPVGGTGFGRLPMDRPHGAGQGLKGGRGCVGGLCGCSYRGCLRGTLVPALVGVRESQEVVPLYYPVPIPSGPSAAPEAPATPPKPYDPTRSRMLIIGAGKDGGGGALRVTRADASTLSLTWLGSPRPTRDVRLFVADSLRETLREQQVTVEHPTARIRILDLGSRIAFSGVTVTYADGAIATTLVPFKPDSLK